MNGRVLHGNPLAVRLPMFYYYCYSYYYYYYCYYCYLFAIVANI